MPSKTLGLRHGMLDDVTAVTATGYRFKAYANIYGGVPEIGCCPPWQLCTVSKNVNRDGYFTAIDDHDTEYELPVYYIASDLIIAFELAPKTRVIASRKQMFFPKGNDNLEDAGAFVYNPGESTFFAGVISDEYRHGSYGLEYLVFFDDGHAQYVNVMDIRVVNGSPGIEHVPENIRNFYDYYFGVKRTLRREADCKINDTLRVLLNGKFRNAKVCKFHGLSFILVHFLEENIFEWIFEGSDRIEVVHKSMCKFLKERSVSQTQLEDTKVNRFGSVGLDVHKLDHSKMSDDDTSTNPLVASKKSSAQISVNDTKMAIEVLIILAQIRHEMNRAGKGKHRIDLFADKSLDRREAFWKRICRFLRINVNQRNRNGLKMLIQNFRNIVDEFRSTYDHYIRPHVTLIKSSATHQKTGEKNAMTIQQEVTSKVQLMQNHLEIRANGNQKDALSVNMVLHLDEIINEFTKLTEK